MSFPEVLLWRELRQQDLVKFRRQHPIGNYVLDFYCARARLCIEIDGIAHDMGEHPTRDQTRDVWLNAQGIEVIRIAAGDVLKSAVDVAEGLVRYCLSKRAPPSAADAAATSPFILRRNEGGSQP